MFLPNLIEKNPQFLEAAFKLKASRQVPANCFLIDLDAIASNVRALVAEAQRLGLHLYFMTKQLNRNPFAAHLAVMLGFEGAVAVDIQCVRILSRYGVPIRHVGHLSQVPVADVDFVLARRPDVVTVYSLEKAREVSEAAHRLGIVQDILLRVVGPRDVFFQGQEGGFNEESLPEVVESLKRLGGVRIAGVTSFPCLTYNLSKNEEVVPTENFATVLRAAKRLREAMEIEVRQVNAPGNNYLEKFEELARLGATHLEPGHAVTATTPSHGFSKGLHGTPALLYLSEVSHIFRGKAYAFGGGFWRGARIEGDRKKALVGQTFQEGIQNSVDVLDVEQLIDYHILLVSGDRCRVGDTVVMGFYTQAQMTRSYVATVVGASEGRGKVVGLFDHACNFLGSDLQPRVEARFSKHLRELAERYAN